MHKRLPGPNGTDADSQAQPDPTGVGQLSSLRLFCGYLLESGPGGPVSTATLGQADAPEQILRLAETEVLQHGGKIWVLRSQAHAQWREQVTALVRARPHSNSTPYQGPGRDKPL